MADRPQKADPAVARVPIVRTYSDWTPEKIRLAERQADAGDLSYAASVCEWLLCNDRVAGALDARLDALFGLEPTFEPGVGRRKNQAIRALEAEEDWWQSYPESQNRLIHKWGLLLGVAPGHHLWVDSPDHKNRWLPQPRFWHPQTLRKDWQRNEWTISNFRHERMVVTPGDGNWVLHTPFGEDRPWSLGLWRSLARWALLSEFAVRDSGRVGESGTLLVASSPEGSTKDSRRELAEDLRTLGSDGVAVLGNGYDLKLVEMSAAARDIYEKQMQMADLAISIRIRGANLSSNVQGGSHAAAEAQFKANETPKLRFDAESFSSTIHDQSLVWWAQYNFGDRRLAPWPNYPVDPEEDVKAKGEAEEIAFRNAKTAEEQGFEVDRDAFLDEHGISWAKAGKRPEPQDPPESDEADDPDDTEDPNLNTGTQSEPRAQWNPSGAFAVALASGASAQANQGFVEGQLYADSLADNSTASAIKALQETRAAILEELDAADSFEDLRDRLAARYKELDAGEIADLTQFAMVMAQLAGNRAAIQDS